MLVEKANERVKVGSSVLDAFFVFCIFHILLPNWNWYIFVPASAESYLCKEASLWGEKEGEEEEEARHATRNHLSANFFTLLARMCSTSCPLCREPYSSPIWTWKKPGCGLAGQCAKASSSKQCELRCPEHKNTPKCVALVPLNPPPVFLSGRACKSSSQYTPQHWRNLFSNKKARMFLWNINFRRVDARVNVTQWLHLQKTMQSPTKHSPMYFWLYPKLDCLVYDLACSFKAFGTASAEGRTSSGTLPVAHAQLGFASLRLISKVVGV